MTTKYRSEIERRRLIADYWRQTTEGLAREMQICAENFRFYAGGAGQWDERDIIQLDADGKPHLSLNRCKPAIDVLSGYQRKLRDTVNVVPLRNGTSQVARIRTRLGRHAMDMAVPSGDYVLSEQCLLGAIGSKSWSGIGVSYSDDAVTGDIQPRGISVFDMLEDPMFRGYDINHQDPSNHCRFVFETLWLTEDQLEVLYPEKIAEIGGLSGFMREHEPDFLRSGRDDYGMGDASYSSASWRERSTLPGNLQQYMIRRCYYKFYRRNILLYNRETGASFDFTAQPGQAASLAKHYPYLTVLPRIRPLLYYCEWLGEQLELVYKEDPFQGLMQYPYFRFCPYWLDGRALGEIDNLKDSQREKNKRRSQMLHHLNQSTNSGWMYQEGAIADEAEWEDQASRSGAMLKYTADYPEPKRIEPVRESRGHALLEQMADKDFESISGMNSAVYGFLDGGKESGRALDTRREQGLTTKEVLFDNFNFTQLSFYTHLIERIVRPDENGLYIYDEQEIRRLLEDDDQAVDIADMRDLATGRYGVKVSRSPTTETARQLSFMKLLELIREVPDIKPYIPPEDLIEASDVPIKDKIIEAIKARKAQLAQQPDLLSQDDRPV